MGYSTQNSVRIPKADLQLDGESIYLVIERDTSHSKRGPIRKRILIGTIVDAQYMNPNDNYWEYFPTTKSKAAKKPKTIKPAKRKRPSQNDSFVSDFDEYMAYLQKAARAVAQSNQELSFPKLVPVRTSDSADCRSLSVGGAAVVRSLIQALGLDVILADTFEGEKAFLLTDLISYLCLDRNLDFRGYPSWVSDNLVYQRNAVLDGSINSLLQSGIHAGEILKFFEKWNQKQDLSQPIFIHISKLVCSRFGAIFESKKDIQKQINEGSFRIVTAVSQNDTLPLFYFPIDSEVDLVNNILNQVHQMGYQKISFLIEDSQLFKDHQDEFTTSGCSLLLAGWVSSDLDELIDQYGQDLKGNEDAYIPDTLEYGRTNSDPLGLSGDKTYFRHLYYNPNRVWLDKVRLDKLYQQEQTILNQLILKGLKRKDVNDPDHTYDYVVKNGWIKSFRVNEEYRNIQTKRCGFTTIITDRKMTAYQAIELWTNQTNGLVLLENLLDGLKPSFSKKNNYENYRSAIFLGFLASILVSQITNHLKKLGKKIIDPKTFDQSLDDLNRIKGVRRIQDQENGIRFERDTKLTKKQNELLQVFGLGEENIDLLLDQESEAFNKDL